ncbi:TPA: L-serine ammonia-lyase, iron-sulfur-dependent, subunit alpha, partial [Aeromonas hydrophila]
INNMIGDVSGIICDGAGSACSMKVSTSTSAAVKSSLMAINNLHVPQSEGIVSDDVDQTIANLGRLSKQGMLDTDIEIINIMRAKQQGKAE